MGEFEGVETNDLHRVLKEITGKANASAKEAAWLVTLDRADGLAFALFSLPFLVKMNLVPQGISDLFCRIWFIYLWILVTGWIIYQWAIHAALATRTAKEIQIRREAHKKSLYKRE